jgi:hypothetical protein
MNMLEKFECEDRYEAEKLAGFLTVREGRSAYLLRVSTITKNEIIIVLNDGTSHSVVLKDEDTAIRLKSLLEDLSQGRRAISDSTFEHRTTKLTLSD